MAQEKNITVDGVDRMAVPGVLKLGIDLPQRFRYYDGDTRLHPAGQVARSAFFDHFDHFLHQYIGVLFCKIFTFLLKKGVQKWVPKNAPIVR